VKILRLDLIAFGPFTDLSLDLSGDGLHLLYGPNEAGKSSALRALRQLLYGIPRISDDSFVHPYKKMRIGGLLQHSDGARIELVRRKAAKNALRDGADDRPLDEARFRRFLGNVDADVFATMFGIGHEDLVRGGEEIVQGGGDVGQALFAAGSGISDLRRVQKELRDRAEALFTPAASAREINRSISAFRETRKALREAQLPGQDWERHDAALREAVERREAVDRELRSRETERNRLARIRDALPLIARRRDRLEERAACADAVLLPEAFGERRAGLLTDLRVAESGLEQAREDLQETVQALSRLRVDEAVLHRDEPIDTLYRELGGVQAAARDRVKLRDRRDHLRREAREILSGLRKDVPLEEAGRLRLERAHAVRIRELGQRHERLTERLEAAREALPRLETRIKALEEALAGLDQPLPVEPLEEALERAAGTLALEDHLRSERAEIDRTREALERTVEGGSLWKGGLEALERLPVPSTADVDAFEERLGETEQAAARLRADKEAEEQGLAEAEAGLEGLALEGEVPTERDLGAARSRRDEAWQGLRRALTSGAPPGEADGEAYEALVRRADELADRLRREADRVARKARFVTDRAARRDRLERLASRLAEAEAARKEAAAAWRDAWSPAGVDPEAPRRMRAWLQDRQGLLERFQALRERERKAGELEREFASRRNELDERLRSLALAPAGEGESLSDLAARCRRVVERQGDLAARREKLLSEKQEREEERREAEARLHRAEQDLGRWRERWEEAVAPLGLGPDASPGQAVAVMEDLAALLDKIKEADVLHKRVAGIDRDTRAYTDQVNALLGQSAPDLEGRPADQAVPELHARLDRAREESAQKARLERERERREERVRTAEARVLELRSGLDVLCEEAGCRAYEELAEAEKRSVRLRRLDADLEALEEQLRGLSGGRPVDAFVEEAREIDPDGIEGRLLRLEEEIAGLHDERSALDRTIGEEGTELRNMDGSPRAAELAEEAQQILGGLEHSVERYARLRIASTVLARAVERYREKHQGPVLERTNALFNRLTLGRFDGVRAEYDEQGTPVLAGVRPGGEIVPVAGMSDGTADQLYLALRLASLEAYLETGEPMPFVVDDILIKFDDGRARAALELLAELSRRTQVIFFTHHRHLVEIAEGTEDVRPCSLTAFPGDGTA
jgi:uncharacterized protein YhaN